jgi:hypothetical protein
LRDALWSSQNSAPDQVRVFAMLCAYIVIAQRLARASLALLIWSSSQMAVLCWYLAPLSQVLT